ncbi:beta-lactamase [Actinoplanes sp. SE50]|uniref:serine hydrolase domain-containing protein n=1 Tax=unclassified Actinoplanes TaxID=2626549 RepID=UPI00023EDCC0|nr:MULTISPECIES: serine hydrolase domain-containing protein [unclassified Actinoplanes]AEV89078.1 D-alanyl-D-alanine carboxypeptidase [Actinoplanes sp. SE50/110]ATO87484.1 beta-lactamase [Actinoplanes sp. SE50]SLM04902.1 serine hydrolase [Actinoplanes sp. SE50/110]
MLKIVAAVLAATLLTAQPAVAATRDPVRKDLANLVADGFPGALAVVRDEHGRIRRPVAGTGDTATGRPVPADGQVRLGSNTKTFVAVVVLQLVAEHRVRLDDPVERYLPGLLHGRRVTVRQILQHTSGLANYTEYLALDDLSLRYRHFAPRELLDLALAHPDTFPAGTSWAYSNTNYIVAGLLVEKVTGRPLAEQITRRVIRRAGLRHTYFPADGETGIRERHPQGYLTLADGQLFDITDLDPSWGWAAGQMVGTPSDLNTFFSALIHGRLLPDAQLAEMEKTVPAELWPGARYGLGLVSFPLSCGGVAWGHGGDIPGYETRTGVTMDGRAATVAVTTMPATEQAAAAVLGTVDDALCA